MKGAGLLMEIIVPTHAKSLIEREVPIKLRSKLIPIVGDGYKLASQALKQASFLNWQIGHKHIGYLKKIAVEYLIKDAIDNGTLPFEYKVESNSNKSALYLEVNTGNAILTVSQTQSPTAIARPAFFREKHQQVNQLRFKLDEQDSQVEQNPYYLLLTHGYGSLNPSFINIGLPNENGWIDYINLLNEPRLIEKPKPIVKEEEITKDTLVGFKEFARGVIKNE